MYKRQDYIVNSLFEANKYFNDQEPWKKKDDIIRLNTIVYTTLEIVRKISFLLYPIIPESSLKALKIFDIEEKDVKLNTVSNNEYLTKGNNIYKSDWTPSKELISFLNDELDYSTFPTRTGNHIESRPGGINFSILGRGEGNMEGRKEYVKWDRNTNERVLIADRIKTMFPDLNIQIGGQTGLDISNDDKSQILKYFSPFDEIHFFGDMMEEGQNDYPLAKAVQEWGGHPYCVNNWEDTRTQLKKFVV